VIQEADGPDRGLGAFWGEVQTNIHLALRWATLRSGLVSTRLSHARAGDAPTELQHALMTASRRIVMLEKCLLNDRSQDPLRVPVEDFTFVKTIHFGLTHQAVFL